MQIADFSELSKKKPEKALLKPIKRSGGRNNPVSYTHLTLPTIYSV